MHKKLLKGLLIITINFSFIPHTSAIMAIDAPLVFDGEARDDSPADGVFDTVSTGFNTADARIQNVAMPTATIEDRIIMEFGLSVIPGGMAIAAATLILAESNDDGAPLNLFGDVGDGIATTTDAEITNLLTGPTGTFGDSIVNTAFIDVTSFIDGLHMAGDPFALFAIEGGDVGLGAQMPYIIE